MYITAQLDAPAPAAAALKRFVCVTVHLVSTPPAEYPRFPARKTSFLSFRYVCPEPVLAK
jgi:hypothetical protein